MQKEYFFTGNGNNTERARPYLEHASNKNIARLLLEFDLIPLVELRYVDMRYVIVTVRSSNLSSISAVMNVRFDDLHGQIDFLKLSHVFVV